MKVLALGASRNIGYFTALLMLKEGHSVYYLLRNTSAFDDDEALKPFVASGQAKLIRGDGVVSEDVTNAWNETVADGIPVDYVLFSIGSSSGTFQLTRGFVISQPNLCTSALSNTLAVIPRSEPQPRVIVISSYGITQDAWKGVPFLVKGVHALIQSPLEDKRGVERVAHHAAGWTWKDKAPAAEVLPEGWESDAGKPGWLQNLTIVRPALLTYGKETGQYRALEAEPGMYTISRKDVAHFIANSVVRDWNRYNGKIWDIGY